MTRQMCRAHEPIAQADGYLYCVEVLEAFADGSSRHDRVWARWNPVAADLVASVVAAHGRDQAPATGTDLEAFAAANPRKTVEQGLYQLHGWWWLWHTTVAELGVRSPGSDLLAQAVKRETLAWQAYAQQLVTWLAFGPVELPD